MSSNEFQGHTVSCVLNTEYPFIGTLDIFLKKKKTRAELWSEHYVPSGHGLPKAVMWCFLHWQ